VLYYYIIFYFIFKHKITIKLN